MKGGVKMRTKYVLFISIIIVLIITLILPASAPAQKILRWAYTMPTKKSQSYGWEWFGPEFEKRTSGRYKVEYYPGETLFKVSAAFDSIASNVAQIANASVGQLEKRLPLSNVALLPTLDFPGSLKARIACGYAFMEMVRKLPQVQEEYKDVKLFGYHQLNPYILASKRKEVYLPEHFKGLKVGGTGSKMKLVSNNGGAEVTAVPPDAYMNMDKGVVDASFLSWSQIWDYKIWETAKYFCDFSFSGGAFAMIMNLNTWNGMSPEDQKIFMEVWSKAYELGAQNTYTEVEKGSKASADAGATIRKLTETETAVWRKAAGPVIEEWLKEAKKSGAKDPETVIVEWKRLIEAYKE
jgi:TRAP-type C4-dicarboxylate transport system substrate-binding protein